MSKVSVTCSQCNKIFLAHECHIKRGQGRFCSKRCGHAHWRARPLTHLCEGCGTVPIRLGASKKSGFCTSCGIKSYKIDPKNKDRIRSQSSQWRFQNPEKARSIKDKSRRTIHGRFLTVKGVAKRRGLEWSISEEQYEFIVSSGACGYCNDRLPQTNGGLDRKDNSLGYTIDNVVPCCFSCNRIKGALLTYDEMKAAIAAILEVRNKK